MRQRRPKDAAAKARHAACQKRYCERLKAEGRYAEVDAANRARAKAKLHERLADDAYRVEHRARRNASQRAARETEIGKRNRRRERRRWLYRKDPQRYGVLVLAAVKRAVSGFDRVTRDEIVAEACLLAIEGDTIADAVATARKRVFKETYRQRYSTQFEACHYL